MNVVVNDTHLYNIADAIRAKGGTADKLLISEMSSAIDTLTVANKSYEVTGDCSNKFSSLTNAFPAFGDYVNWNCHEIDGCYKMFYKSDIEKVPFQLHFKQQPENSPVINIDMTDTFRYCQKLKEAPVFANQCKTNNASFMFSNCNLLREVPEGNIKFYSKPINMEQFFGGCYSLRSFPMSLFEPLNREVPSGQNTNVNGVTVYYNYCFSGCMALDELVDLPLPYVPMSSVYNGNGGLVFSRCYRLARLKFRDDGRFRFNNCTIDLSTVGYANSSDYTYFLDDGTGNSGITSDKMANTIDLYNTLKEDPDWFTTDPLLSRYNKVSALETINSLPDMNAI